MAQRNIDFGSFPDDPSADAIRTAFQKVQENFTEVFAGLADQAVASVNKTPGPGVYLVNGSPVGNVVLGANIACVQVETSTLGIGIGAGNNVATYASLTSSAQVLTIDLPSNIANITDVTISGKLTANYVNANIALTSTNNLFVTSNANVGNLNSNNATITSNLSAGNINAAGNLVVTTNANITGTLGVQGNAEVGNLNTSGLITATGNITGGNLVTGGVLSVTGNANVGNVGATEGVFVANVSAGNLNTTGALSVGGNANVGNLGTGGLITATGNIDGGNINTSGKVVASTLESNIANGTAPFVVVSSTKVANLNADLLDGYDTASSTIANTVVIRDSNGNFSANVITATLNGQASTANTVTDNTQPNITSLGTLIDLNVSGNASFTGSNIYISNIANFRIPGGTAGYTIKTDGSGNLVWGADTAPAGGSNTQVQFNDEGSLNGAPGLTFNKTSNLLSLYGGFTVSNVSATVDFANTTNVNLGSVNNLRITGGASNTVLTSNGSGGVSFIAFAGTPPGGPEGAIQYNKSLVYTGESEFLYNESTNTLTVDNITLATSGNLIGGNIVTANFVTGTLTTNAQPNITSVGTLTGLIVNGNINGGRTTVSSGTVTSNIHALTVLQTWNNPSVQFSALEANIIDTGSAANSLLFDLQVSNVSQFAVSKEGNIFYSGVITGNGSGLSALSGANVSGQVSNALVAGTVYTNSQPNITSVGTLTSLAVSGNTSTANLSATGLVEASRLTSNVSTGTAPLAVSSTTRVANLNVSYANVSDFTGITSVNTGTFNLMLGNVVTGNVALSGNTGFTANVANGSITAVTFVGSLSGTASSATVAGTVTTNAQPNITSVGTLTSLTSNGNITGANVIATGYHIRSVTAGISANGSNQTTATVLTTEMNIVSSVSSGQGVRLPNAVAGMQLTITNLSANALLVYPHSGGDINGAAANLAYSQAANSTLQFITPNTTDWYTVGATYS